MFSSLQQKKLWKWNKFILLITLIPSLSHICSSVSVGTGGQLCLQLSLAPSEYSYFNMDVLNTWAGPQHWKLKPKSKGTMSMASRILIIINLSEEFIVKHIQISPSKMQFFFPHFPPNLSGCLVCICAHDSQNSDIHSFVIEVSGKVAKSPLATSNFQDVKIASKWNWTLNVNLYGSVPWQFESMQGLESSLKIIVFTFN